MRFYEIGSAIFFVSLVTIAVGIMVLNYFYDEYYPDDNLIEEVIEKKIENVTGLDIDLTPESKESDVKDETQEILNIILERHSD